MSEAAAGRAPGGATEGASVGGAPARAAGVLGGRGERRPTEPFVELEQQHQAATLGVWAFLATEILLFGALIFTYVAYRHAWPEAFAAASARTDRLLGTLNTAVLLTSSLTMALAVRATRLEARHRARALLALTTLLGCAFLAIKGLEYRREWHESLAPALKWAPSPPLPAAGELFFVFYFIATLLHAIHLAIGILVVLAVILHLRRAPAPLAWDATAELTGLYWHFVDIVWIFLYPALYLVHR